MAVLNAILKELQTVQLNKKKLKHLIDRCRRVIVAIDEELGKRPPSNVDSSIRQLVRLAALDVGATNTSLIALV